MEKTSEINRKEFLQLFGTGAVALLATACLGGCSTSSDPVPGATSVDVTLDLTSTAAADLNDANIGYVYVASRAVIVAKTTAGTYIAVQAPCTHEGVSVTYNKAAARFVCPRHNSQFADSGTVLSGVAPNSLKKYTVVQTGNSLRITS